MIKDSWETVENVCCSVDDIGDSVGAFDGLENLDIIPRKEVVLDISGLNSPRIRKTIPVVLPALFELVLACVGGGDAVVTGAPATDELVVGDELDGSGITLDDSVDVSAARGVLDVEASVTGGIVVEDRTTLNVDVTRVDGCGGSGGNGRGEEDGTFVVDEGGAGALLGRLVVVADGCACVWVAVAVLCCPFLVLVHFFSSSSSSQSSSFSSGSFSFSLSCLA
ncbi:hypothetical protein BDP67DRAFT_492653 [Colletotrichum lupini]|nr:hypothetical protein BDP67DRAFT_492653 [Colletotrichum lupini]